MDYYVTDSISNINPKKHLHSNKEKIFDPEGKFMDSMSCCDIV
jgi:hypothetical protein